MQGDDDVVDDPNAPTTNDDNDNSTAAATSSAMAPLEIFSSHETNFLATGMNSNESNADFVDAFAMMEIATTTTTNDDVFWCIRPRCGSNFACDYG